MTIIGGKGVSPDPYQALVSVYSNGINKTIVGGADSNPDSYLGECSVITDSSIYTPLSSKSIDMEDNSGYDFTLPGHNYLGPGTKVLSNLNNNVLPTDVTDLASLKHDVAYLLSKNQLDIIDADLDFIVHDSSPETLLAGLALLLKDFGGFTDTDYRGDISVDTKRKILNKMEELVSRFNHNL